MYPVPCTMYPVPCTMYPVPCTMYPVPCTMYPRTMYHVPAPVGPCTQLAEHLAAQCAARCSANWVHGPTGAGTWYMVRGYMVHGTGYMVHGTGYMVHGTGYMVHGTGYMVHGTRVRVRALHDQHTSTNGNYIIVLQLIPKASSSRHQQDSQNDCFRQPAFLQTRQWFPSGEAGPPLPQAVSKPHVDSGHLLWSYRAVAVLQIPHLRQRLGT